MDVSGQGKDINFRTGLTQRLWGKHRGEVKGFRKNTKTSRLQVWANGSEELKGNDEHFRIRDLGKE